jgi:hypothetical protein
MTSLRVCVCVLAACNVNSQRRFLSGANKFKKWVVNMSPFTVNNLINLNILRFEHTHTHTHTRRDVMYEPLM